MSRRVKLRPQRPSELRAKTRIPGRKVKSLEVRKMEAVINRVDNYREKEMSYEEFCEPFKKIGKILKDKGITSEEMQKRHERSRAEYAKKYHSR